MSWDVRWDTLGQNRSEAGDVRHRVPAGEWDTRVLVRRRDGLSEPDVFWLLLCSLPLVVHGPSSTDGASWPLDLRDRVLRPFQQPLHFFDIDLRRRIVLMPHHLLDPCRIGVVEERKGRRRVAQAMHHNAGFLDAGQEQTLRDDAMNRARGEPLLRLRHHVPPAIITGRRGKEWITPL